MALFRSKAEDKVRAAGYDPSRLPPGQYLTDKWPVLHAGSVPSTDLPGSVTAVVPLAGVGAHEALVADPSALREVALALADRPPTCETLADALVDRATGEAVSWAEDRFGAALAASS